MNHTIKERSALVREAEAGLRRERFNRDGWQMVFICVLFMALMLLAAFLDGPTR